MTGNGGKWSGCLEGNTNLRLLPEQREQLASSAREGHGRSRQQRDRLQMDISPMGPKKRGRLAQDESLTSGRYSCQRSNATGRAALGKCFGRLAASNRTRTRGAVLVWGGSGR